MINTMRLIGNYSFIFNKKITCAVIAVFSILLMITWMVLWQEGDKVGIFCSDPDAGSDW